MARKSKRGSNGSTPETPQIAERIPTAIYARLSVDKDGDESVHVQISMLERFIADYDNLQKADVYADTGFSGTDFERPEFKRMIDDVCSGKIRCIVVKDLSRFGRDLIDAGNYIENVFPKLGVRFIAVTDNFDSSRQEDRDSIALPVKNMVNAMYAREFSKKQTVYFEQHSRIGDIKYGRPPYGYLVDKEKNILVPDPVTAPVVQMIFRWFLLGVEVKEIYERLNDMNLPSPYAYKRQTEGYADMKRFADHVDKWKNFSVSQILHSEVYIGDRVLGKKRKILYKGIVAHRTAPDEWITHKNTHEPLVTTEDFEKVQEKLRSRQIINNANVEAFHRLPDLPTDHFRGKVYCLECGRRMIYMRSKGIGDRKVDKCASYRCYDETKSGITSEVRHCGKAYTGSMLWRIKSLSRVF